MEKEQFDLAILGGGPGGYACALRAAQLGLKVALVEKDKIGGLCLHKGCVPTKFFLQAAQVLHSSKEAEKFGLNGGNFEIDWPKAMAAKAGIVDRLYQGLQSLFRQRKIQIFPGVGSFRGPKTLAIKGVEEREVTAKNIVLAVGSVPKVPSEFTVDGRQVFTSDEAVFLKEIPSSLIILGGGPVGVEFATIFHSLGTKVTVVELFHLLPQEDGEISSFLGKAFRSQGIQVYEGTKAEDFAFDKNQVELGISVEGKKEKITSESLLLAMGRSPALGNLGLERVGIEIEKSYIKVNSNLETTQEGIYAVGDTIPTLGLAHAAFSEGIFAAEQIGGLKNSPPNYDGIPRCIYSFPEVASVGLTEEDARERGYEIEVSKFPFAANSKALILGEAGGFAKIVAEKGGPILGIHLVGPQVTELISEAMLAFNWEASCEDVASLIHPHPTLSEVFGEAALALSGKPFHLSSPPTGRKKTNTL